jgi:hypothetical protein
MKKLTSSVLCCFIFFFAVINAQKKGNDTIKEQSIGEVVITGALGLQKKQMLKLLRCR